MAGKTGFTPVARVHPDAKGRVTLGALARGVSSYRVAADREGRVLLEPFMEVPAREQWLWKNQEALQSVLQGIADAGAGRVRPLVSSQSRKPPRRARTRP